MSKFIHALVIEHVDFDENDLSEYGQPTAGTPSTTDVHGLVQPRAKIDEMDDSRSAGTEIGTHVVFLPLSAVIEHSDAILFDGGRYEVVGVRRFRYGGLAHLEVDARLISSTPAVVSVGS